MSEGGSNHRQELSKYNMHHLFLFDNFGKIIDIDEQNIFKKSDLSEYKDNYVRTVKGTVMNDWWDKRISDDTMTNALRMISDKYYHLKE